MKCERKNLVLLFPLEDLKRKAWTKFVKIRAKERERKISKLGNSIAVRTDVHNFDVTQDLALTFSESDTEQKMLFIP